MSKHTPTPWRVDGTEYLTVGDQNLYHKVIRDPSERWIALVECEDAEGGGNAAHIVRCVNEREELLSLLQSFMRETSMSKLNIRKDFGLINIRECAKRMLDRAGTP